MVCHKFKARRQRRPRSSAILFIRIDIHKPYHKALSPAANLPIAIGRDRWHYSWAHSHCYQKARKSSNISMCHSHKPLNWSLIDDRRLPINDRRSPATTLLGEIPNRPSPIAVRLSIDTYDITDYDYGARVLFMYAKRIMRNIYRLSWAKLSLFNTLWCYIQYKKFSYRIG